MRAVGHPGSQAQSCRAEGASPQVPQVCVAGHRRVITGSLNGAPLQALPSGDRVNLLPEAILVTDNRPLPLCPGHRLVDVRVAWWEPRVSQPELHEAEGLVCVPRGGGPERGSTLRRVGRGLPAPTLVVQALCQTPVALEACVEALAERNALVKSLPGKAAVGLSDTPVVGFGGCAWEGIEWKAVVTSKVCSHRRGSGASRIRVLTTARKQN